MRWTITAVLVLGAVAACTSDKHPDASVSSPDASVADAGRQCPEATAFAPTDVFCIGLYENHDPNQHVATALAYTPGVTLWSDGAVKQRYFSIPDGTQIDTSDMDSWKFPVGTKAWKEFRVDGVLIETRLIWKQAEANWVLATYVWDSTESQATLNTSRQPRILDSGYEIPAGKDCGKCHNGGSDKLLGVEAIALALPTTEGLTLAQLVADGALTDPPATTSIRLPEDGTGKAAAAIGYLHANCGMPCHSARGLGDETQLLLRLRADQFWTAASTDMDAGTDLAPLDVTQTDVYRVSVNTPPTTASVAQQFPGANRITPGNHEQSLLWLLPHRRGNYQMPPLVSHKVDDVGTQRIADWIDALTSP